MMTKMLTARHARMALAVSLALSLMACGRADPAKLLQQADEAMAKGDSALATIHLKNAVQAAPDSAQVRLQMARSSLQMADFSAAEIEARKALELGLEPGKGLPVLLEALGLQGEHQKLIDEVGRIRHPDAALRAQAQMMAGRSLLALGKVQEAGQRFEAALQLQPALTSARVGQLAVQLVAKNDAAGVRSALDGLLAREPGSFEGQVLLATLARGSGQTDQAKAALVAALNLRPYDLEQRASYIKLLIDNSELKNAETQLQQLARIAPKRAMTHYLSGLLAFRQGNLALAQESTTLVVSAAPAFTPGLELAAEVALQSGETAKAEALAKQVLSKQPTSAQAAGLLAAAYLAMNSPERALSVLAPLVNGTSAPPALLAMAGEALLRTGDATKGVQFMEAAARAAGDTGALRVRAAEARLGTGDEAGALQMLEAAARENSSPQVALSVARSLASTKRFDQALVLVRRYVQQQPGDANGFVTLGSIAAARGDKEEAAKAFQQALALNPVQLQAVDGLAVLDLAGGKLAEAKGRYQALIKQSPKMVPAYVALARLSAQNGAPDTEVLAIFKQAREHSPGSTLLALEQSRYLISIGQAQGGAAVLQPLVTATPDDLMLAEGLASALEAAGEPGKAIPVLERALQGHPLSTALNFHIGMLRGRLGDFAGAMTSFKRAAELQPHAVEPRIAMAGTLHNAGRKPEAYAAAKALQESMPRHPAGASLLGDFLSADGKPAEALAQYQRAFDLAQTPVAASKLYKAFLGNNQMADAQALLRKWWATHPGDVGVMLQASEWLLARKDWKEAAAVLNEVLKVAPNQTAALNNAAIAVHQLKEPKAVQLAERAYQLEPNNPSVMDTYGWILSEQGRGDDGLKLLRAAAQRLPRDATVQLHLAEALARNGDRRGAAEAARKLIEMNPPAELRAQAEKLAML